MKTNDNRYTEQDWKLFKSRIADWQEAYMDKLNKGYIELLSGEGLASDKFWKLENKIREDKKKSGVCIEMRRSTLIINILNLLHDGAITMDDLEGFSDELRDIVGGWAEHNF